MKFKYGVGNKLNILHDSPANIEYRKKYLQGRLSNLNANGLPINTEVFLDESYVHLDHHSKKTWFEPGTAMREKGRKPMLVIFGAFVGFRQDNQMTFKLVENSILIWPVKGQAHIRPEVGQKRGRKSKDEELWHTMPQVVKDAQIAPDYHDYHGNFNAEIFESLFDDLCKTLQRYGSCHIHMDGAKYHVRCLNPKPNRNATRKQILEWYDANNYRLPRGARNQDLSVEKLREKVMEIDHAPTYPTYDIARKYGHQIKKTPPYHCELQPIEKVWSMVKNRIAHDPVKDATAGSVRTRLLEEFARIKSSDLRSIWEKTVLQCKQYQQWHSRESVDDDDQAGVPQEFGDPEASDAEE